MADQPGARQNGTSGAVSGSPAEIERAIQARRDHLAATVGELGQRAKPKAIVAGATSDVREKARAAVTTSDGGLRTERIAAVAGASLVVLVVLVRIRRRR